MTYKYNEDQIVQEFVDYLNKTKGEHYQAQDIECFDAWMALGDATSTFRDTAIKYLWRYGKKGGNNKDDLLKAMHYVLLMINNDHYRGE